MSHSGWEDDKSWPDIMCLIEYHQPKRHISPHMSRDRQTMFTHRFPSSLVLRDGYYVELHVPYHWMPRVQKLRANQRPHTESRAPRVVSDNCPEPGFASPEPRTPRVLCALEIHRDIRMPMHFIYDLWCQTSHVTHTSLLVKPQTSNCLQAGSHSNDIRYFVILTQNKTISILPSFSFSNNNSSKHVST